MPLTVARHSPVRRAFALLASRGVTFLLLLLPCGLAIAQTTVRSEQNYQDAILKGMLSDEPLSVQEFTFLDYNGDGDLNVVDLLDFLLATQNDPPTASFERRRTTVNEGTAETVRVMFSKRFTGILTLTVRPSDGPDGTQSAVQGQEGDFEILAGGNPVNDLTINLAVNDAIQAEISVSTLEDVLVEPFERVELQLAANEGYVLEAPTNHYAYIRDNDGLWSGAFVKDGFDNPATFKLLIVQDGDSFTGEVVVPEGASGLFPIADNGAPVTFSGTNPSSGEFTATIAEASGITAGMTRFNASFARTFILNSSPGLEIPSGNPAGPETVAAEFDRYQIITGTMSEQRESSNPGLSSLAANTGEGSFALVRDLQLPDNLVDFAFAGDAGEDPEAGP